MNAAAILQFKCSFLVRECWLDVMVGVVSFELNLVRLGCISPALREFPLGFTVRRVQHRRLAAVTIMQILRRVSPAQISYSG